DDRSEITEDDFSGRSQGLVEQRQSIVPQTDDHVRKRRQQIRFDIENADAKFPQQSEPNEQQQAIGNRAPPRDLGLVLTQVRLLTTDASATCRAGRLYRCPAT